MNHGRACHKSIIPDGERILVWLILPNLIPIPYNVAVCIVFWLMTIVAMGDAANVYHVVKEVPKGSKVFNHGMLRSFYIVKDKRR